MTNDEEHEEDQKPHEPEVFALDVNEGDSQKMNDYESKSTLPKSKITLSSDQFSNVEELDEKIRENLTKIPGKGYECIICQRLSKDFSHAKEHGETHFEGLAFPCSLCPAVLRSRASFAMHKSKTHR